MQRCMGRKRHALNRFRLLPAASRALYRRVFRRLSKRYPLPASIDPGRRKRLERLFCRLMHKQQLAHKLGAHHRGRSLVLDKRFGTAPGSLRGATIPEYFRKRILRQRRLAEAIRKKEQLEKDEPVVVVDDDACESISSDDSVESDTGTESDSDTEVEEESAVEESDTTKQVDIPDPTKFSEWKQEIKEYCSIQEKVGIIIAMLKSRAQELEKSLDAKEENVDADVKKSPVKQEPPQVDAELESLKKYYDNSDEEEPKVIARAKSEQDSDVEIVEEEESKPEIVFVDANALTDDSKDGTPSVPDTKETVLPTKSLKDICKTDLFDPTFSTIKLEPVKTKNSVIDSLFSRFNLTLPTAVQKPATPSTSTANPEEGSSTGRLRDRRKIAVKPRYVEEDDEPKKVRPSKIFDKIHQQLDLDLENTNSNSSTEFYGFDEGDVIKLDKPNVPGLLPTPIVKKSRPNAPFLAPGTIAEDIKIENRDDLFREEGLISFGSLPPRLECPRRPDDMIRPRTVAQKRILLQKKNDIRYLMIDNESKIFNELEKRGKNIDVDLDQDRMEELQDQNIPFTRDTWKALAWLRTEKGKYFFQSLRVDNHYVKLTGCKGNHPSKRMGKKQLSAPATVGRKHICHCPEYAANVNIDLSLIQPPDEVLIKSESEDTVFDEDEQDKRLLHHASQLPIRTRPGPLSSKFRYDSELLNRSEDGAYLGPLEIFEMPSVEIEVFPRIDRPLDPTVKPYLKMMLPFRGITEKWARFAVSTLKTPDRKEEDIPDEDRSFSFTMPYLNNQRRILIRRRVAQPNVPKLSAKSLARFEKEMKEPLEFRKHLDVPDHAVEIDPVEEECADVLSELTDAVALSLAGDVFISDDPDCDYTKTDKPVQRSAVHQDATKNAENAAKSKRMLREMKRLNATIIETVPDPVALSAEDIKAHCDKRYCARGCICDVFSTKSVARTHCSKIDCIFGCQCGYEKKRTATKDLHTDLSEEGLSALTSEDVKYLRERATAKLAKEERDFTPTVIMTTNSTVLVRNSDTETRRNKKKPKKYDDYYNENSVKSLMNGTVPDVDETQDASVEGTRTSSVIGNQPLSLQDRIRHTHVVLNKLQDLENVEPWCMIHCLYRCYCHGNATIGKPFKFNEENDVVLPTPAVAPQPDPLLTVYEPRRRRLYSFEKTETITEEVKDPLRKRDSSEESYKPWNERRKKKRKTLDDEQQQQPKTPDKKSSSESTPSSTRASIEDLQINDGQTCRRAIPVNKNFYRTRNYYRKGRYQKEIEEMKRKNPNAEKRLKMLLEQCEKTFFEERKHELETKARVAMKTKDRHRQISEGDVDGKQRKEPVKEPIFFDIVGTDAKIQQNILLSPLVDTNKTLIYCGKKKYYVETEAIESGKINLMNIARKFRRTVCILKRVESDNRAKPITFTFKNETIMLKGRKYRMNEPYEQRVNEHLDFDCESDDQDSAVSLIQETGNTDNVQKGMLDQVNSDIMHTMQHIREMMRKNTSRLNAPKKGILYIFRWEKFLQAFNEDTVDVWDITFQNGSDLVILTTENNRKNTPSFKNTKAVRLARKCTLESRGISLLTKMILHQVDNPETNRLSLVLFGTDNYWRFCGFIKADSNFVDKGCEVRPTPATHPKLAPKISRYFEAFVASQKKQEETTAKPTAATVAKPAEVLDVPKPIKEEEPTASSPDLVEIPAAIAMVKSNVKLMETKIKDFKNIAIPNVGMRRWFMLNIANDFSDIYIPSWKSCLTYGRIKQAIQLANRYKKTVRLTSIALKADKEDVLPQIYAAPMQGECIFLGPYSYTQNIDLILCQNVDGKMYSREEYERNNHIVRTEHTTGSWLYMKPNVTSTTTTTLVSEPGAAAKPEEAPSPTPTVAASSPDDDCVVIEDDEETVTPPPPAPIPEAPVEPQEKPPPEAETSNNNNNNNQLESLIHQLYNDSDSDDDTPSETSSTVSKSTTSSTVKTVSSELLQSQAPSVTNQLSLLVEKTITESKQLQIKSPPIVNNSAIPARRMSHVPTATFATPAVPVERKQLKTPNRRMSYIPPAATTTISAQNTEFIKPPKLPNVNPNVKRKSTGSTEIEVIPCDGEQKAKKNRSFLPAQAPSVEDVVCLDDDDDDEQTEQIPSFVPKAKTPSCTTVLNSQQAALIASKINLLNPNQKGVVYNPSTGVLRIKRSLMNSLTEGTNVVVPPSSSSKPNSNSALGSSPTSTNSQMASTATVTPAATPQQINDKSTRTLTSGGSQLRIDPPKQPTDGVLRSHIPGLGMVPVRWSPTDIIIKVRELSVKHQYVRLANFEAAVVLLNRFIRKNTYTFKPFSLSIGWKFEANSNALAADEQLINTINLRCVVTTDGVIDLYKASAIIAFQNTKPNFYEELLLLRLSILCCKKETYEQEQCHKYFENIFVKATNSIKELTSASDALTTQSNFLREQQAERRSYLATLKESQGVRSPIPTLQMVSKRVAVPQSILDSVSKRPNVASPSMTVTPPKPAAASQSKESVIVLDDD